ncbi:MAG: hypothetical protein U5K84_09095 [Alkalibacterium sp.]|nr:hypothetical protein [Alkalibacterium sp.]
MRISRIIKTDHIFKLDQSRFIVFTDHVLHLSGFTRLDVKRQEDFDHFLFTVLDDLPFEVRQHITQFTIDIAR